MVAGCRVRGRPVGRGRGVRGTAQPDETLFTGASLTALRASHDGSVIYDLVVAFFHHGVAARAPARGRVQSVSTVISRKSSRRRSWLPAPRAAELQGESLMTQAERRRAGCRVRSVAMIERPIDPPMFHRQHPALCETGPSRRSSVRSRNADATNAIMDVIRIASEPGGQRASR
jgi:hypothetical protein